ncbi:hypothetical protein [Hymenobacter yonginensis]|uniref:Uncharacterized protein n=1 Tax=Hymenobacter yonginensis TaxID=748197 RepID=A0ABY7PKT8_9BACT|nr:hypothetical protein [Hymenobacter yonginensis]WBO83870.1 hypothetical protein O9Z63_15990 [Hymenobacter yonginensis]
MDDSVLPDWADFVDDSVLLGSALIAYSAKQKGLAVWQALSV